jgi:hypothetical protein
MTIPALSPMFGEVSDKVSGLLAVWVVSIGLATFVFACRRFSRWSLVATVPLAACIAWSVWREFVADTYFRQAVLTELGYGYLIQLVACGCIPLIAALAWSACDLYRLRPEPAAPPDGGPARALAIQESQEGRHR